MLGMARRTVFYFFASLEVPFPSLLALVSFCEMASAVKGKELGMEVELPVRTEWSSLMLASTVLIDTLIASKKSSIKLRGMGNYFPP